MDKTNSAKVYFVGAGPGDPDLITVKGLKTLQKADVIIYTDSLVSAALTESAKPTAEVFKSSGMVLEDMVELMVNSVKAGKLVVRLHTGDPSIFGAIHEQIVLLKKQGVEFEVIPGVSSAFAAAAALGIELTIPELTQTVIFTRADGRTPVPKKEKLSSLAEHEATLAIYLSATLASKVTEELLLAGWAEDAPVAIVQKASFTDQKIVRCTVVTLEDALKKNDIKSQAIIFCGYALEPPQGNVSKLYDKSFSHGFRKAKK